MAHSKHSEATPLIVDEELTHSRKYVFARQGRKRGHPGQSKQNSGRSTITLENAQCVTVMSQ